MPFYDPLTFLHYSLFGDWIQEDFGCFEQQIPLAASSRICSSAMWGRLAIAAGAQKSCDRQLHDSHAEMSDALTTQPCNVEKDEPACEDWEPFGSGWFVTQGWPGPGFATHG